MTSRLVQICLKHCKRTYTEFANSHIQIDIRFINYELGEDDIFPTHELVDIFHFSLM